MLVNVFVPGGLDLLDTLVPGDAYGRYADLRPALKVAQPVALRRHAASACTRRWARGSTAG